MIDVQFDFKSGGSGRGVSYYKVGALCPRRTRLQQEEKEEKGKLERDAGIPEDTFKADKGTVFHKLAEVWHTGKEPGTLLVDDIGYEPAIAEGQRLFSTYKQYFPPDFWGEVLGAETHLPGSCDDNCPSAEMDNKTACRCSRFDREQILLNLFGVTFTLRIDLIVNLTEADCKRIGSKTMIPASDLVPGVYLLDHKTADKVDNNAEMKYNFETQFPAYLMAFNQVFPEMQVKGMLVNRVVAHKPMRIADEGPRKPKSFWQYLVPFPSETECTGIGSWLQSTESLIQTDWPNRAACFMLDFGRPCRFLENGKCDRT